jgi:hypothetical protein
MATPLTRPKCGAGAPPTRRTCAICGTPLRRASPWVPMLGAVALLALAALGAALVAAAVPLYRDGQRYTERVRTAQRTSAGLLLIVIGCGGLVGVARHLRRA